MFEVGDKVRLVNLPAHPGLEGLTGTVRSTCDEVADIELDLNKMTKRLKTEKLRKLITGSVCELHGLIGAFKLNGQLCEVREFDSELQRYNIVLGSGVNKKVKPENLKVMGTYRATMATPEEVRKALLLPTRKSRIAFMENAGCVLPQVISARILADWSVIDDAELREKLLRSKQVPIASLSESAEIVYLSVPRNRVVCSDHNYNLKKLGNFFQKHQNVDLYYLLPWRYLGEVSSGLSSLIRGIQCSFPLVQLLVDRVTLLTEDKLDSLRSGPQRLDVQFASITQRPLVVHKSEEEHATLSLPSRGRYDDDQESLLKEYESIFAIKRI